MKRIAMLLLSFTVILAGCESDSNSSNNDLTPVLDANGQAVTDSAGDPLFTNADGNVGTEAELTTGAGVANDSNAPTGGSGTGDLGEFDESTGTDGGGSDGSDGISSEGIEEGNQVDGF